MKVSCKLAATFIYGTPTYKDEGIENGGATTGDKGREMPLPPFISPPPKKKQTNNQKNKKKQESWIM